jgi:hypothetical protein
MNVNTGTSLSMVNKMATEPNIELKQLFKSNIDNDDTAGAVITADDVTSIPSTVATTPSPTISETDNKKKRFIHKIPFKKSWLLWWNSEEWWSCWIGMIFFGCIASAVKDNIPSPQFLHWEKNPFSTFAAVGHYDENGSFDAEKQEKVFCKKTKGAHSVILDDF